MLLEHLVLPYCDLINHYQPILLLNAIWKGPSPTKKKQADGIEFIIKAQTRPKNGPNMDKQE